MDVPSALRRSHYCGQVGEADLNKTVVLMGWVQHRRDHGGCVFVDLRDREGIVQVVFDPSMGGEAHALAGELRSEWVIGVRGQVRSRGGNVNERLATGTLEVAAAELVVHGRAKTPPFAIEDHVETAEEVRLRHRYLDLRRPSLQHNLRRRHRFNQIVRQTLDQAGFLELETPFLIRSTPEGARDYVVPSRVNPGQFFALPQSPQLFKQLFMVAGYDRYFQIVRCFRDEDLRAERQPEFTQIDIEMSFGRAEDVQEITEQLLSRAFGELLGTSIATPFARLSYDESMARFGVDAPDLRFGLELVDLSAAVAGGSFQVFDAALAAGGMVKGINLTGVGELSRKDLDDLTALVRIYNAKGLAWARMRDDGSWQSPIAKFLKDAERAEMGRLLGLRPGDVAVFMADQAPIVHAALGNLRKHVAKQRNLIPAGTHRFCWITDFPLFEYDAQARRYFAAHHPFTAPQPQDRPLLQSAPDKARAQAYDITLNGVEIGGGSIRIHDSELQQEVFSALGIGPEEASQKFGFLLEALQYGAPPHGGIALGVDRIMMQICGTPSIRDVIAFPKTQKQTDLMLEAPAELAAAQLQELCLKVALPPGAQGR